MSELIQKNDNRATIRWKLLTGASTLALMACVSSAARAEDSGQPAIWIEMGVSTDKVHDSTDSFALPIGSLIPPGGITGPLVEGLNLSRSIGEDGKITFRPHNTDWVFSASVTYGRSRARGSISQQAPIPTTSFVSYRWYNPARPSRIHLYNAPVHKTIRSFSAETDSVETHAILDFSAGKDVGLGMFGHGSTSEFGAGVRYANFTTRLNLVQDRAITRFGITYYSGYYLQYGFRPRHRTLGGQIWHNINGRGQGERNFIGVGPSLHWDASVPLVGNEGHGGEFLLDWGANAAILFGKQKNKITHRSTDTLDCYGRCQNPVVQYAPQSGEARSTKTVTVPNLGGFAGISYRLRDFKASFGYRIDYFYRAIDTGVSGQHAVTRSFQGPFINVSVGIGD